MKKLLLIFSLILVFLVPSCVEEGIFDADGRLPLLETLLPNASKKGDLILIIGKKLQDVDTVYFNGAKATFVVLTDTSIQATVPAAASSGPISASNPFGLSIGPDFIVLPPNAVVIKINSILPTSGKQGNQVKITGVGFNALSSKYKVRFNGLETTSTILSDTEINATVPANAKTGAVSINNNGPIITGPVFTIVSDPPLLVQSIAPATGQTPIDIIITGQNFGTNINDIQVRINGLLVVIKSITNTTLTVTIAANATTGAIAVKKLSTNQEVTGPTFTVLPPDPVITVSTLAGATANDNVGSPFQIVKDGNGGYYFSDPASHRIKKISASGVVTNYAGTGQAGFADGKADEASFNAPSGLAIDATGNLYVADLLNHAIRKIAVGGFVTTLAGFGQSGYADGDVQQQALFNQPIDVAVDGNSLFISDFGNHAIRLLNMQTGIVSTYAGTNISGFVNGALASARFNFPIGITLDANKNILVADAFNHSIRLINRQSNQVSTVAGNGTSGNINGANASARFNLPYDVDTDANGNIYAAERNNHSIRKVTTTNTSTVAGTGIAGFKDGEGSQAQFNNPFGVLVVSIGELLICDYSNGRIRKITIN